MFSITQKGSTTELSDLDKCHFTFACNKETAGAFLFCVFDKMEHLAAECLVSMSSRAIVHGPKGNREIRPETAAAPRNGEETKEALVKDNSSLFVVARILADFNQQSPTNFAEQAKTKEESMPPTPTREDGNSATPTAVPTDSALKQRGKRWRARAEQDSPQKKHKCHYPGCEKVYGKSSHLKAHLRTHTGQFPLQRVLCHFAAQIVPQLHKPIWDQIKTRIYECTSLHITVHKTPCCEPCVCVVKRISHRHRLQIR